MTFTSPAQLREFVAAPEYDFLRTNPHLGNRIMFLTLGGSHAYGTNVEGSDVDIRGCALQSRSELIGMSNFEQVIDNATDTTVYAFNKFVNLLCAASPNVIELLGCKPEHYFRVSELGLKLLDQKKLFLSQRAVNSFGGYATSQLRRLQNALAHDALAQSQKEEHIRRSMEGAVRGFEERYTSFEQGSITLFTDVSKKEDLDTEVFCNIHMDHFPARELNSIMNDLTNVIGTYDKLNNRNNKKDDAHLNKHAQHLIRLYLMGIDILENEQIVTYREKEHDLLMSIRNGEYQNEDHTFRSEFFDMVSELEARMKYAAENTSLPRHPNMKLVEEFVMDINERSMKEEC